MGQHLVSFSVNRNMATIYVYINKAINEVMVEMFYNSTRFFTIQI